MGGRGDGPLFCPPSFLEARGETKEIDYASGGSSRLVMPRDDGRKSTRVAAV